MYFIALPQDEQVTEEQRALQEQQDLEERRAIIEQLPKFEEYEMKQMRERSKELENIRLSPLEEMSEPATPSASTSQQ